MKKEQALQIATNFYTFREGSAPRDLTFIKQVGDIFIMGGTSLASDEVVYEIEVDPTNNRITMKEIVSEYRVGDFAQQPKMLSELKRGDLFRLESDRAEYEFWKPTTMFGEPCFLISRKGKDTTDCVADRLVYPIGK